MRTQVGDDGTDKEQNEANGGGRPDQRHANAGQL